MANVNRTGAVRYGYGADVPLVVHLVDDLLHGVLGHGRVGFVFELGDGASLVVVSGDAVEYDDCAIGVGCDAIGDCGRVDRVWRDQYVSRVGMLCATADWWQDCDFVPVAHDLIGRCVCVVYCECDVVGQFVFVRCSLACRGCCVANGCRFCQFELDSCGTCALACAGEEQDVDFEHLLGEALR